MGHTNSTANLALPQFIGTDKPTWLGDVNGAFSAIDSKVGTIDADISAVDAKADNAVADASNAVTTATNANNTAGTASTTATNALNIANNALTVANNADGHTNQLETKVGLLANLTTTDKTSIVNAINEVNAKTITVSVSAEDVSYNNTVSGLTATDVQAAIDEVVGMIPGGSGSVEVVADGVKTRSALLDELYALIDFTKLTARTVLVVETATSLTCNPLTMHTPGTYTIFNGTYVDSSAIFCFTYYVKPSASISRDASGVTVSDHSTLVPASGTKYKIIY